MENTEQATRREVVETAAEVGGAVPLKRRSYFSRAAVAMLAGLVALGAEARGAGDEGFFRERVEPILRERCYGCHSHASGTMEGMLALDWKSGWETGGDRGPAIRPGDPDLSLLIQAVRHTHAELKMPEERLPESEIGVLVKWVKQGAHDPRTVKPVERAAAAREWWSLRDLLRPQAPLAGGANPVDAFLNARLTAEQLPIADDCDRVTLIRRLTNDLWGLPPTSEEVAEFVADDRPDAVERLIDRLLASPHYGERWARHWFDVIHFADSHGFEHDVFRPHAWRFRDYVIAALNEDISWSQFIREQLAVDVFWPEATDRIPALGFLGAGTYDHSAAVTAPMSFELLDRDDLVTQVMGAFVSTTAHCARCHAHKFDPISQEDYYSVQAVFAGIGKGNIPFDADRAIGQQRNLWQNLRRAAERRDAAVLLAAEWEVATRESIQNLAGEEIWRVLLAETFLSSSGAVLTRQVDESILASGPPPETDTLAITAISPLPRVTAIRVEVLVDDSLPMRGPGRATNGNLHLSEFELRVFRKGAVDAKPLAIRRATADFNQEAWTIEHAIDGNPKTAWGIHPREGESHVAVFELAEPLEVTPEDRLMVVLKQLHGGSHLLGRVRVSLTDSAEGVFALPADAAKALAVPPDERSNELRLALAAAVLGRLADDELARLPAPDLVYAAGPAAVNERGTVRIDMPREIRILRRGDLAQPGDVVGPGALAIWDDLPARFEGLPEPESARRAALADWLANARNRLTWRSVANRVWHYHFGQGLSNTPSDFGQMGSPPSHPELLDWLACEIRDGDQGLKHLHRLLCASEAYRRSSSVPTQLIQADPENRLLGRGTVRRLDAEAIRDAVLRVSDALDETMTGPAIAHFSQKPGAQLTPILDYSTYQWTEPGSRRRAVYGVVWRGIPDPFLETVDLPELGLPAPVRSFSASPLQALSLLNDRFLLQLSSELATQIREQSADDLRLAMRMLIHRVWLRDGTEDEVAELSALANEHGLEAVCRLLFNCNEFLFVD